MKKGEINKKEFFFSIIVLVILIIVLFIGIRIFMYPAIQGYAVLEEDSLFNLKADIPEGYKEVYSGEKVVLNINIMNLANTRRMDVILDYSILDSDKTVIDSRRETIAIETQASLIREIEIPERLLTGKYYIDLRLISNGKEEAHAREEFRIIDSQEEQKEKYIIAGLTFLSLITLVIILRFFSRAPNFFKNIFLRLRIRSIVKERLD